MPKRQYYSAEGYIPAMEGDTEVLERIKTSLSGECDGQNCLDFESLGPLNLLEETWESKCVDRRSKHVILLQF